MNGKDQSWRRSRLGDVLTVKHGFAFKGEDFAEDGRYIVVTPGNFADGGGFKAKESKEKYYSADPPDEFVLSEGDLILALTDLKQDAPILGSPAWVPVDGVYLHNQRIGRVVEVDEQRLDSRFTYYLFCTDALRAQIRATATGATVRHTGRNGSTNSWFRYHHPRYSDGLPRS